MGFSYDPRDAIRCLPEGDYQATVEEMQETTSKAGNPMLVVTYKVYATGRGEFSLKEYIVKQTTWKLKQLAKAVNANFESGEVVQDEYVGRNVVLSLGVEEDAEYGDKNIITAVKAAVTRTPPKKFNPLPPAATVPASENDIPF